ncbi:MAG: hypothetical protein Q9166_004963 [cf. Caloplaca sp. 2 TL-2023]
MVFAIQAGTAIPGATFAQTQPGKRTIASSFAWTSRAKAEMVRRPPLAPLPIPRLTSVRIGNTGGSVRVTQCQDGSYCCGTGTMANTCCTNGNGVFIAKNGETTNVKPKSTISPASTASSTLSTSNTTTSTRSGLIISTDLTGAAAPSQTGSGPRAADTKTVEEPTNNTSAIAGGVVGGLVAAALIVVAGLWFLRQRRTRGISEKGPFMPYTTTNGSKPGYSNEVEGSNARMELPAPVGHEMGGEGLGPKKHQVHELQQHDGDHLHT